MLTDIFANRYAGVLLWERFGETDARFLVQAFRIISEQLYPYYTKDGSENQKNKTVWKDLHDKLSMELGLQELSATTTGYSTIRNGNQVFIPFTYSMVDVCKNFILAQFGGNVSPDRFMKERISFIELTFRERGNEIELSNAELPKLVHQADTGSLFKSGKGIRVPGSRADGLKAWNETLNRSFRAAVDELNIRLRQAGYSLNYHNGFVQCSTDTLVEDQIEQSFWSLITGAIWKNVDIDMKEAIDRRDRNGRDPAFYAARALESAIKIISNQKGWTHGRENGAHNYIDNLRSRKNGEFINEWEMKSLKDFFTFVRNPFGHGAGDAEMPSLSSQQTDWAIEFCMIWIKNLIRRQ